MNYEDKYKTKYLELKNIKAINQIGGGKEVLKIKDITKNNFNHIIELNSGKDEYVASNSYTIIEAFLIKKLNMLKQYI